MGNCSGMEWCRERELELDQLLQQIVFDGEFYGEGVPIQIAHPFMECSVLLFAIDALHVV